MGAADSRLMFRLIRAIFKLKKVVGEKNLHGWGRADDFQESLCHRHLSVKRGFKWKIELQFSEIANLQVVRIFLCQSICCCAIFIFFMQGKLYSRFEST